MPVQLADVGSVEPFKTIEVKALVSGELKQVHFNEGDDVDEGQVLFTIDPRPYEVALQEAQAALAKARAQADQARANLVRDKATAANAEVERRRDEELLPKKMISQEEYDATRTAAEAAKAAVAADDAGVVSAVESIRGAEAAIADAQLQLDYCTIRSPIQGRTGQLLLHQGNLVKANDTSPLVVINQVKPIFVTFTLPERYLSEVRKYLAQGPLEVQATLRGQEDSPSIGRLSFIDNAIKQDTGTIRLKATFDNEDGRLWPGQFVNAALQVSVVANAVVIPSRTVQAGQSGPYVYVVKPDLTAELRPVKLGQEQGDRVAVEEGLQPGERVISDGQVRVIPGGTVSILADEAQPPTPTTSPAAPEKSRP